jgi:SLOG-like protein
MTTTTERPLAGCVAGISISETRDMERLGFARSDMNRCVVRVSEALLAAGARLAFGHDWRPGGVMMAVAALAVRYFRLGEMPGENSSELAPILNRVAPPDVPFLLQEASPGESAQTGAARDPIIRMLKGIVDARQVAVPDGTDRPKALSLLREELAELCDIRICLGGKIRKGDYTGAMPGIVEEALGALRNERPVFTSAIFGGASAFLVHAVRNGPDGAPEELRDQASEIQELWPRASRGLDPSDQTSLWNARSIDRCVELILRSAIQSSAQQRNGSR